MSRPPRRFPVTPLLRRFVFDQRPWEQVGVNERVWQRVVARGYLTDAQADLWAVTAGLHPCLVWDDWHEPWSAAG